MAQTFYRQRIFLVDSRVGGGPEYENKLKLVPVCQFHQKIESSIFDGTTSAEAIGNVQL